MSETSPSLHFCAKQAGPNPKQPPQLPGWLRRAAYGLEAISRSHISMWVLGTKPSGRARHILRETLSRRLGRRLTPADLGLEEELTGTTDSGSDWSADPLTVLAELGSDDLDMHRRKLLATAASWWEAAPAAAARRKAVSPRLVAQADIDDVRDLTSFYSARDQQRGGASGRSALAGHGVRPTWRKTGTARRIHDALLSTRDEPFVTLMVNPAADDGRVHALYKSWGYEDIGQSQPSPASPVLTVMIRASP